MIYLELSTLLEEKLATIETQEEDIQNYQNEIETLKSSNESQASKHHQAVANLMEKIAILGTDVERLEQELSEKNLTINSLQHNMNASDLQCSTLQVLFFVDSLFYLFDC